MCGKTGDGDELYDEADYEDERVLFDATESSDTERPFYWTQTLQQSFREELEKYVILCIHHNIVFSMIFFLGS